MLEIIFLKLHNAEDIGFCWNSSPVVSLKKKVGVQEFEIVEDETIILCQTLRLS